MRIIHLRPDLIENNARIRASEVSPRARGVLGLASEGASLSGTIHSGYSEVSACVSKEAGGTIQIQFEFEVPSISAEAFDLLRLRIDKFLGDERERALASEAGIAAPPPPPASRMACYAACLIGKLLLGGVVVSNDSLAFNAASCAAPGCVDILRAIRALDATRLRLEGSITVGSQSSLPEKARAYVPLTSIEFDDGLTVPFSGYSDNLVVVDGSLEKPHLPLSLWREEAF
jgi:hypothetical protein